MKFLWDFPEEYQGKLVEIALSKYGSLIGTLSTPHSSVFTFDRGSESAPRYVVAKGIRVSEAMPVGERRKYLSRALYEVNNAYAVCHHPSIHRFFHVELVYGVPFLLSRKREATLRDVVDDGPLPESEIIGIAVQIVHALNYCASRGLMCHQDLKPDNVFVDFMPADHPLRHRALLADFELANAYLILRHPYGSRPYMAPEQYHRQSNAESIPDFSRVDVFALGVILYEMLTGGIHPVGQLLSTIWPTPAQGKSRRWLREDPWKQWVQNGAPLPVTDMLIHSELLEIVRACLNINASERLSKQELEACLLARLARVNKHTHETLTLILEEFDKSAREGEIEGWPYYSERLEQLNEYFSDDSL